MARIGPSPALPSQPLNPARPVQVAATAAPATPAGLTPRDGLNAPAASLPSALTHVALVDDVGGLTARLERAGTLSSQCEHLAHGVNASQRQALDNLQALLMQPEALTDSLAQLSQSRNLSPGAREYLNQLCQQTNQLLDAAEQGDAGVFRKVLSTPLQTNGVSLPLAFALQNLQQTLAFDQTLQRRAGRELLVPTVNQAFQRGLELIKAGVPLKQVEQQAMVDVQKGLGKQNKDLLLSLARGDVQQSIDHLQQRFAAHLQVPGFVAGLQQAMTEAGLPADKIAQLGSAEVMGKMPMEMLDKVRQSLAQQLQALPDDASHAELRQVLNQTLENDLPQIVNLRSDFQCFRVTMLEHVSELTGDLLHFARSSGLELPAQISAQLEADPLAASAELNAWIAARRHDAKGHPERLHALDGLQQFALQLTTGATILNRVERGERIDRGLVDNFADFQTFILAKRALIQAFEHSPGDRRLRNAILDFGDRFADWQQLGPAERQQAMHAWLGGYLDQAALAHLEGRIQAMRDGFDAHNQRVEDARQAGIELVDPQHCPPRADNASQLANQRALLSELAQRESAFYRHLLATQGDEALSRQLHEDLVQVLDALAASGDHLLQGLPSAPAPPAEAEPLTAAEARHVSPVPTIEAIGSRIEQARIQHRLDQAVEALKGDLLRSLRDTRRQSEAQAAASRLQHQLETQIFEMHNQRQQEAQRHRLQSLEQINDFLKRLLAPETASVTP